MARPSRHRIELSDEERSELEWIARAEKRPWREVQRARIVLYAADGRTDVEIAARLDTSAGIVGRLRRRFFEERLEALTPNDFGSLEQLGERLLAFGRRCREIARRFERTFTRSDLERVLERVDAQAAQERPARAHLRLAA